MRIETYTRGWIQYAVGVILLVSGSGCGDGIDNYAEAELIQPAALQRQDGAGVIVPVDPPQSPCGTVSNVRTSGHKFVDGKTVQLDIHWDDSSNADHGAYDVFVYFYRRQGGTLSGPHYGASFSAGRYDRSLSATVGRDTFSQLGAMDDSASELWQIDVRATVRESCVDRTVSARSSYRPMNFLVRPVPEANLGLTGMRLGDLDTVALQRLQDQVEAAGCQKVLLAANSTTAEGKAGPNGIHGLMRGQSYDCVVNIAYHDKDNGYGGELSDDTRYYCGSINIGRYALHYAWLYAVHNSSASQFNMFGHSKGAAVVISRHQNWPWVATSYPAANFYALGVPERKGSEYLSDYEIGYTKKYGPVVAMTWSDDPVHEVSFCGDGAAAYKLSKNMGKHDYSGFAADHSAHGAAHSYNLENFQQGTYDSVGRCYRSNDTDC